MASPYPILSGPLERPANPHLRLQPVCWGTLVCVEDGRRGLTWGTFEPERVLGSGCFTLCPWKAHGPTFHLHIFFWGDRVQEGWWPPSPGQKTEPEFRKLI